MPDVEARVAVVEMTQKYHESEIKQLKAEVRTTVDKLGSIERQLSQIKWIAVGAVGMKVASEVGLFSFLQGILL